MSLFPIPFLTILAVAILASSLPASAVDGRTCMKARDLKDPAAVAFAQNPASVLPDLMPDASDCTLGKLSLVCLSSFVNADAPSDSGTAECCFKARCEPAFGPLPGLVLSAADTGAGTFGATVDLTKTSLVCVPCTYTAPAFLATP